MTTTQLTDRQWARILDFLRQDQRAYVGDESRCRRFVEAAIWMSRSGAQSRILPEPYGNWNSVYKRFSRWCDVGVWERMLAHFAGEPDMQTGLVDSTIVRAHACAAGAQKKRRPGYTSTRS
jgi:transposase